MMKHKILIAICCTLILCALTGCQLAKENAGPSADEDKLIGVFITTEYLDLFDFDTYLNDNVTGFQGGEINMVGGNTSKYQGRIYADLVPRTDTYEETCETIVTYEYVFDGIEGISYCVPTIQETDGENNYIATLSDPAISDGHTSINTGDDENSVSLEGTIYVSPSRNMSTFYFNPIYQSADGSIYLVSGDGFTFNSETYSEGSVYSQILDDTTTVTENGKTKTDTISIKVSISIIFAPEKIVILQMDPDDTLISRTEYKPDLLPDVLALETSAAYFIVETHKRDNTGSPIILRDIYGKDVENIDTFFVRADGICEKHVMQVDIL